MPPLLMKKQKLRDVKGLFQGHTANIGSKSVDFKMLLNC